MLFDYPIVSRHHAPTWLVLAALAGCINAGGFLACGTFVSHVTGFATLFGVNLGMGRWEFAVSVLTIPIYFLLGGMIAAFILHTKRREGIAPPYWLPMFIVGCLLVIVSVLGGMGWFGGFGDTLSINDHYFFLILLCLASGIQNAVITAASRKVVRTTHLTGITTDLGIGLIDLYLAQKNGVAWNSSEVDMNLLRAGTIASFIIGSCLGGWIFAKWQYTGFWLPSLAAFVMSWTVFNAARAKRP